MYPVRLTHPENGFTHAYDKKELEDREKTGWKVVADDDFRKMLTAKGKAPAAPEVVSVEPVEQEAPRRGRPRKVA